MYISSLASPFPLLFLTSPYFVPTNFYLIPAPFLSFFPYHLPTDNPPNDNPPYLWWSSNLKEKVEKNTQAYQKKKKKWGRVEETFGTTWNITTLHHGDTEVGESEKRIKNPFEQMTENFPNLVKVKDSPRIPNKMDPKRPTPRHIIIKNGKAQIQEENIQSWKKKSS